LNPWEKGVWCLTIALTAAVLVKLYLSGLIGIYKLLFGYLALDFTSSIAGLFISFHSKAYALYYFSVQTVKITVAAFMLVEIYSLALERHPALAQFGRSMVGYILAIAAVFPVIGVFRDRSAAGGAHPYIRFFFLFEQTMDATMAIFLILLLIFLAWFPVRMRRNVIVYIGGFIVWSLSRSAVVHLINQWFNNRHLTQISNIAQMCVTLGCLLFWMEGFKREGEARTAVVGHLWNRAEAERLTERLDAINDGLARMRHKVKQH
jgi:hypothetical protein